MVSPRDLAISPSLGSATPAMQRSSVDLPRPLAATSPMRSPALTERSSRENSGALSVTPRLRILRRVMVVPWACRPTRRPGHAALIGCSCGKRGELHKGGRERSDVRRRIATGADQEEMCEKVSGQARQPIFKALEG